MAAITHRDTTASTSNAVTYTSGSFTPARNDLLVFFAAVTGTSMATPRAYASANNITFSAVNAGTFNSSADRLYLFVANQLVPANPTAMTVTVNIGAAAGTGAVTMVASVSGVSKTGPLAIRQTAKQDNQTTGTPAPVFGSNVITGNPTLGAVGLAGAGTSNTAVQPSSTSELGDVGYATPLSAAEWWGRASGFTGTTVTWTSATVTTFASMVVEIDASLTPSSNIQLLSSPKVVMPGSINYVGPVSSDAIIRTNANLAAVDMKATLQFRSRFPGDTNNVDAVRFRALEKNPSETILTGLSERMVIGDSTAITDYRSRPQLFHREYGAVFIESGPGPVSIDSTPYPWKTVAFFAKPMSSVTTLFRFGSDESLVATDQGSGRWSINVPSGYTCYIGGSSITDPQTVDFTMPRLIVLTNSTLKTGVMYFGSTGGNNTLSSMSLNHIYVMPVALTAGQVTDFYKRFYGQQSLKVTDSLGTSGSIASIRFVASNWTIGTVS